MGSIDDQEVLTAAAQAQFTIHLRNTTNADNVHAYITGTDPQRHHLFFLRADGKTPYYPANPPSNGAPLGQNCAIKLGGPGSSTPATIPHTKSGRIYFVLGKLDFALNHNAEGSSPHLVEPTPTDGKGRNAKWGFAEFTWNAKQMYANISFVDFVGLPIALSLKHSGGKESHVSGLPAGGLAAVCSKLEHLGGGWARLVLKTDDKYVRALSPDKAMASLHPQLFADYYDQYINKVWQKYQHDTLLVKINPSTTLRGHVENDVLKVGGETFGKPSSKNIFDNATGPFENQGTDERKAIIALLCAAFNRSTLLENHEIPDPNGIKDYYKHGVTNHYAKIVHGTTSDGKGYAFAYDDVTPFGGKDQSGKVQSGNPESLTVTVGGK